MKPIKPFEPYKVDQTFKNPTTYGPHEGWDINGLGGGNTDLNTPLLAVADGEIVHVSESTKDYGKLLVLRCKTLLGDRWVRYAHCNSFMFTSGPVKRGDVVAFMGSTGNSTASHLHFDVLKKQPSSWRYYGKASFSEHFEDPNIFFDTDLLVEDNKPPVEPVTVDFGNFVTSEETYGILPLETLKSKLTDKDSVVSNHKVLKEAFKTQTTQLRDLDEAYRKAVSEHQETVVKLSQENQDLREENQKLKNDGFAVTKPLARWLLGLALFAEGNGKS